MTFKVSLNPPVRVLWLQLPSKNFQCFRPLLSALVSLYLFQNGGEPQREMENKEPWVGKKGRRPIGLQHGHRTEGCKHGAFPRTQSASPQSFAALHALHKEPLTIPFPKYIKHSYLHSCGSLCLFLFRISVGVTFS